MIQSLFALLFVMLSADFSAAQPITRPKIYPITDIYIRGIHYKDHSRNTWMSPSNAYLGQFVSISSRSLVFSGAKDVRVILQEVGGGGTWGVTAYRLTNVRVQFMTLSAQLPNHPIFRGRNWHVTVFVYGNAPPYHYAYPGIVKIH